MKTEKIRVGLLTFHNALNYGAALQVYASQKILDNMGARCTVIDYVNIRRKTAYDMQYHAKEELKKKNAAAAFKYCAGSIFMKRRRKAFREFYGKNLTCTDRRYASSAQARELNGKFDKFIAGSDQIWNYNNNGKDFAYFLDFIDDDEKKISYASSFGLAEIPEDLKEDYKKNLNRIKHLSAREDYGVKLIKTLTGREAEMVLDPVFLLARENWLSLCKSPVEKTGHIFCYLNRPSQWRNFLARTGYPARGLRIHKMTRHVTFKDFLTPYVKVAYSLSPPEFIESIAGARLVVSASFHCISMAIILNVPFVAILTGDMGKDERLLNILRITGLENRILNERMTADTVDRHIDFKQAEFKLDAYRKKSLAFLQKAIFE